MKFLSRLIFCWMCFSSAWGQGIISVEVKEQKRLGIQVSSPRLVREIPVGLVPATVTVPPESEYVISAPLAGIIDEVKVVQGESVTKGQVLIQLRSPELLRHQQHLLGAWQEFQVAKAKYEREKPLFQQGIIAKGRWLETRKNWRRAATTLAQARGELEILGLPKARIEWLLRAGKLDSRLPMTSPDAGVVTAREAIVGQRVERLAPLFRLTALRQLWLEMAVPANLAMRLKPKDKVVVEGKRGVGRVRLIAGTVNPGSQTVRVVAELIERQRLRPGLKVNARLYVEADLPFLALPRSALVSHEGKSYVFVIRSAETFRVTPISLAALTDTTVYIRQGLKPGDQVVSQGIASLKAVWLGGEE